MTSRRPGAPRSARRPVAPSGARRTSSGAGPRAGSGSSRSGGSRPAASRSGGSGRGPSAPSGSAAGRGPAAASRPRSAPAPETGEDGPGITITRRTLVLVSVIVIALAALVPTVNSYVAQRQQVSELRAQVAAQQGDVEELRDQVDQWEDPAYVAARARERLLFAMPGETQYRLTDTSGQDVPLTEEEEIAEAAQTGEWYATLWDSVEGASRLTAEDIPDEEAVTGEQDGETPEGEGSEAPPATEEPAPEEPAPQEPAEPAAPGDAE